MLHRAFISCSHAADGRLAPALQRALERYGRAWYQRAAIRIFRDDTNLSIPRFREQAADILAALTERPKDVLIGEDVRVRRTARRWAWSNSSLLFVLLLAATAGGVRAFVERNAAQTQAEISLARQLGAQAELVRTLQGRPLQRSILSPSNRRG